MCVCVFARPVPQGLPPPLVLVLSAACFFPSTIGGEPLHPPPPQKKKKLEFLESCVYDFSFSIISRRGQPNEYERAAGQRARTAQGDHGGIQGRDQTCK